MVWRLWIAQRGAGVDQVMVVLKRVVGWLWAGGVASRHPQLGFHEAHTPVQISVAVPEGPDVGRELPHQPRQLPKHVVQLIDGGRTHSIGRWLGAAASCG